MYWVDFIYNCVLWIFWLYILPMVIVIIWNKITGDKWKTDNPFSNILSKLGVSVRVLKLPIPSMPITATYL